MNITPAKWRNSSATQIGTFRKCPRRWWWEKVAGYKTPPTKAMARGSEIHAELEAYLKDGTIPTDPVALAGIEYLPQPDLVDPSDVERRLVLEGSGLPVPIIGYIDLVEPATDTITDHKTTSDFRYIKSPEVLAHDPQAIIYAEYAFRHLFANKSHLDFRHVYYRTRGRPDSRESVVTLSRVITGRRFEKVVDTVQQQAAAREQDIANIEPELSACSDYGGCPFISNCNKVGGMGCSSASIFTGISKAKTKERTEGMGLLDKIKNKKQEVKEKGTKLDPKIPSDPITINPPDGTPMDQKPEEPKQRTLKDELLDPDPAMLQDPKKMSAPDLLKYHHILVSTLEDEEFNKWQTISKLALWHAEGRPNKRGVKPKKPELLEDVQLLGAIFHGTESKAAEPKPTLGEVFDAVENDKPIPGNPGPALEEQPVQIHIDCEIEDDGSQHDEFEEMDRWEEPDEDPCLDMPPTLYIGCVPRSNAGNKNSVGKAIWLDQFLATFQAQVAEGRGVAHYSLVDYAKGEKEVAALLKINLESRNGLPQVMIADRRMSGIGPSIEVLVQMYPHIVERIG